MILIMKRLQILTLLTMVVLCGANTCSAIPPFKKPFEAKYAKPSEDDAFKAAYKTASCNACHVKGKKKDWLNAYGLELARLISGIAKERLAEAKAVSSDAKKAENKKLVKELKEAFKKAEAAKSPSGEAWGEMLKQHRIPTADGAKSLYAKDDDKADNAK